MKTDVKDLTQGNLAKQILIFSLPLMLSNILQVLFNMSDIAVVGQFAGANALGSVGSTTTLVTLFTGFLIGMGSGVNVLVALRFGAKNEKEIKETVHTALVICLMSGVLLSLIGIEFSKIILELLNTKEELIEGALLYLRIYFLGMPALAVYNYGNAVFSAVGDTKRPLRYLTLAGIINVILNLFFVIVCKMDVAGVAIASITAQYISAFLILRALFNSKEVYALCRSEIRITKDKAAAIIAVGVPSGIQYAIFQIANLFVQMGVNSFSAVVVSGNSAAANADNLVYDVMAAFYTACGSFMGQNYGAKQKKRVLKSYFISLAYSFVIGTVMGVSIAIMGQQFLSLFTNEPAVIEAGMQRLIVMALSYGVSAFMDCTIAASRGLGESVVPMFIVIMGSCVFRIIWIYTIFAYFGTITSLYLLYVFSWGITALFEILYFIKIYRKKMNMI